MALYSQETIDNISRTHKGVLDQIYISINGNKYIGLQNGLLKFIIPIPIEKIAEPIVVGKSELPSGAATENTLIEIKDIISGLTVIDDGLKVYVTNQIDLTTIISYLLAIKNSVEAIDINTDTVEQKIIDTITAMNNNFSINHTDLVNIYNQIVAIDANTDTIEAGLASILAKIISAPATENTLSQINSKTVQQTLQGDAIKVYVSNQLDLTTIQNSLSSILTKVTNIDANTDTVETKLQQIISDLSTYSSLNHTDLISAITQLQSVNANTDTLEAELTSILNKIITAPSTESTLSSLNSKFNSLGQKVMDSSIPVVVSSNQSPIPVTINQQTLTPPNSTNASAYSFDGKAFSFSGDFVLANAGGNNNVLLIKNPTGSGKLVYIQKITLGTQVGNVSIGAKLFSSPIVTANGIAKTLTNNRIGNISIASTLIYQAPTTSSSGIEIRAGVQGQNANHIIVSDDSIIILQENQSLLLTGNPLSNSRSINYTITLIEI